MRFCFCFRVRCCFDDCGACCLSAAEREIRASADTLFDVVNTETNACGCTDESLSRTETMLLLSVLNDDVRRGGTLRAHAGLVQAIVQQLQAAQAEGTDGGREITREELKRAVLRATSAYQREAVEAIAAELSRDYANLEGAAPLAMDRGMVPGQGGRRLLP